MLSRKRYILAGAVLAALPVVGKAATITFTYDPNDIFVNGTLTALGGTASAPTLSVPAHATVLIGVDVEVDGVSNTAYHNTYDNQTGTHHDIQPQYLGIANWGMGLNTSNSSAAAFDPSDDGTFSASSTNPYGGTGPSIQINGNFGVAGQGVYNSASQLKINSVSGGNLTSSLNTANANQAPQYGYGGGAAGELFNSLVLDAGASGSTNLTPIGYAAGGTYGAGFQYFTYTSGGTANNVKPVYTATSVSASDTVNALPTLAVTVVPSGSSNKIISLTTTTGYTSDNLTVAYNPATGTAAPGVFPPAAQNQSGYVNVTGIPATGYILLELALNGAPIAPGDANIQTIINNINTSTGGAIVPVALTGALSQYSGVYDLAIPVTNGASTFAYDFTSATDPGLAGVSVTEISAVPEPATAAGIILGAAGLLLGRRKTRIVTA